MKKITNHLQLVEYLGKCRGSAQNASDKNTIDVLIAYSHHLNMQRLDAYPSYGRIAAMAGVHVNTVSNIIKRLEKVGVITVERRNLKCQSNIIRFSPDKVVGYVCGLTSIPIGILNKINNSLPTVDEIIAEAVAARHAFKKAVGKVRENILSGFKKSQLKPVKTPVQRPKPSGHATGNMIESRRSDAQQELGMSKLAEIRSKLSKWKE